MELIPYVGPILGALAADRSSRCSRTRSRRSGSRCCSSRSSRLEGHIVAPQVFGHTLRINPLLVIFALLFGGELYGIVGALVALPVAAVAARDRRLPAPPPRARAVGPPTPLRRWRRPRRSAAATTASWAVRRPRAAARRWSADERPVDASPRAEASPSASASATRCATSLQAAPASCVAIIGPNGAGKTTLLSILGRHPARRRGRGQRGRRARSAGCPQQPAVYAKLSVAENLRLFARLEKVADADAAVDADARADRPAPSAPATRSGTLSGGNRQRVNIAVGLLADPPVLLLDEPSPSLDPRQRERLWEFIDGARRGAARRSSSPPTTSARPSATPTACSCSPTASCCSTGTPRELERARSAATDARLRGARSSRFLHAARPLRAMRWLLLKDLQILRRSPLLVALLVALPGRRSPLLIGFALSRGPEQAEGRVPQRGPAGGSVVRARRRADRRLDSTRTQLFKPIDPVRRRDARAGDREGARRRGARRADHPARTSPAEARPRRAARARRRSRSSTTPRTRSSASSSRTTIKSRCTTANAALTERAHARSPRSYLHDLLQRRQVQPRSGQNFDILGLQRAKEIVAGGARASCPRAPRSARAARAR